MPRVCNIIGGGQPLSFGGDGMVPVVLLQYVVDGCERLTYPLKVPGNPFVSQSFLDCLQEGPQEDQYPFGKILL